MCFSSHYLGHRQDTKITLHPGLTPEELSSGTPPQFDDDVSMTTLWVWPFTSGFSNIFIHNLYCYKFYIWALDTNNIFKKIKKSYLFLSHGILFFSIKFFCNAGLDPQNWFQNSLMGHYLQFEKDILAYCICLYK